MFWATPYLQNELGDPRFFYVFYLILSFSTVSQSFKKTVCGKFLGANVLNVFLRFWGQSAKKTCLRFAIFNFSEKLQNIFEIGLRKCELIVQKSLLKKNYFEIKNSETRFCCLYAKLATVKIWEQSNKFPLTCSSLKCPLLVKKLFRENSAEKISCFANKLRPQTHSTGFSDNWANQRL